MTVAPMTVAPAARQALIESIRTEKVADIIRAAAASEIMPRFRNLRPEDIREKTSPTDLVTAADLAAEQLLTEQLTALLPGSTVVGEEAVAADETLLDRLAGTSPVWVIDPVDGTSNFAEGIARFAVIVALVADGETLAGWIHDPCDQRMAWAVAGQGAYMGNRRLKVADPVPPSRMTASLSSRFSRPEIRDALARNWKRLGEVSGLSSAGQEYLRLVEGGAHAALYHRLMPWDHAAGVLIHHESGGYAARLDGSDYRPTLRGGGLILTPDQASWTALRSTLLDS